MNLEILERKVLPLPNPLLHWRGREGKDVGSTQFVGINNRLGSWLESATGPFCPGIRLRNAAAGQAAAVQRFNSCLFVSIRG